MKILHVIPSIGPARGGPSVVIRTLTTAQAEAGIEVHVATTDDDGPNRMSLMENDEGNVKYWIFPRQTRFYIFSWPLTRWLRNHIADYDAVHIHALFSYPSIAAAACARLARVPYILRPLGTLANWGMQNRRRWLKKLSFRLIESRILKNAAAVQYTCEQEAVEANQLGVPHNHLVIPNPVDLPDTPYPRGEYRSAHGLADRKLILFLSRLDRKKGLDLLLTAFARLQHRCPDACLVVAGDGDPAFVASLKHQADSLGIQQGLLWPGYVQGQAKQALLADADLFVLPSYSENFGVAVVEAMGAGLPVIVSDQVGIHREIAEAGAGRVVECSAEQLESALYELLTDAPLRAQLAANAAGVSRRFTPKLIASVLTETYARVIRNQPGATCQPKLPRAVS